ncbi:hypothetical protein ABC365_09565 [Brevundimonas sp. 3P9-tot-E]|uniref:hypothetical protein n=1 Tax=Brevundimonas TaxID=41275 RepID=UPI0034D6C173
MFKIAVAAVSAVGLMSCTAHDASAQRLSAASPSEAPRLSPDQGRLLAYTSINLRMFETLGACEQLNRDGAGDQAFAAHLRRHAPTADQAERRALRAAYDRGRTPAVAARQTPETCAIAMRGYDQETPELHGRRDDRPLASPKL